MPHLSTSRVAVLRAIEGATVREVGAQLGLTANGVHQHLRLARIDGLAETDGKRAGWRLTPYGATLLRGLKRMGL